MNEELKRIRDEAANKYAKTTGFIADDYQSTVQNYNDGFDSCFKHLSEMGGTFHEAEAKKDANIYADHVGYNPPSRTYECYMRGRRDQHSQSQAIFSAKLAEKDAEIHQLGIDEGSAFGAYIDFKEECEDLRFKNKKLEADLALVVEALKRLEDYKSQYHDDSWPGYIARETLEKIGVKNG